MNKFLLPVFSIVDYGVVACGVHNHAFIMVVDAVLNVAFEPKYVPVKT